MQGPPADYHCPSKSTFHFKMPIILFYIYLFIFTERGRGVGGGAIPPAPHFADESAYVARYVSPKCISVWLFTAETLFFFSSKI